MKAAQLYPAEALIHNDLGLCFRRQRELEKSIVALQKAVQIAPDNAKYRNNLAAALVDVGRTDEAFKQLAAQNPPAVAHYNLAHLLEQKSQRDQAVQHLQQAVAMDPSLTAARDMLAQLTGTPPTSEFAWPAGSVSASQPTGVISTAAAPSAAQAAAAVEPPSYHVGDDSNPAASLAQRPNWSSQAPVRQLPPID
jgi:tetratricopeptide (TPR) repeat protein